MEFSPTRVSLNRSDRQEVNGELQEAAAACAHLKGREGWGNSCRQWLGCTANAPSSWIWKIPLLSNNSPQGKHPPVNLFFFFFRIWLSQKFVLSTRCCVAASFQVTTKEGYSLGVSKDKGLMIRPLPHEREEEYIKLTTILNNISDCCFSTPNKVTPASTLLMCILPSFSNRGFQEALFGDMTSYVVN